MPQTRKTKETSTQIREATTSAEKEEWSSCLSEAEEKEGGGEGKKQHGQSSSHWGKVKSMSVDENLDGYLKASH